MNQVYRPKFLLAFSELIALSTLLLVVGFPLISYLKYDATPIDIYNKVSITDLDLLAVLLKLFLYSAGGALVIYFSSKATVNENGIVARNTIQKNVLFSWDQIYEIKPIKIPFLRCCLVKSSSSKWSQWAPYTISQDILVLKKIESINA